jgi:hypothetical protein
VHEDNKLYFELAPAGGDDVLFVFVVVIVAKRKTKKRMPNKVSQQDEIMDITVEDMSSHYRVISLNRNLVFALNETMCFLCWLL